MHTCMHAHSPLSHSLLPALFLLPLLSSHPLSLRVCVYPSWPITAFRPNLHPLLLARSFDVFGRVFPPAHPSGTSNCMISFPILSFLFSHSSLWHSLCIAGHLVLSSRFDLLYCPFPSPFPMRSTCRTTGSKSYKAAGKARRGSVKIVIG